MAQEFYPLELKSKRLGRTVDPLGHLRAADVKGTAAAVADQVLVGLASGHHRLVGIGMAELNLPGQPQLHQQIQGPIYRRPLEAGQFPPDAGTELIGRGVPGVLQECAVDQPSLGSESSPLLPQ